MLPLRAATLPQATATTIFFYIRIRLDSYHHSHACSYDAELASKSVFCLEVPRTRWEMDGDGLKRPREYYVKRAASTLL